MKPMMKAQKYVPSDTESLMPDLLPATMESVMPTYLPELIPHLSPRFIAYIEDAR